jgi:hypothetical protein
MITLLLLTMLTFSPAPARPWSQFSIHFITEDGSRKFRQYDARDIPGAMKRFEMDSTEPEIITCIASRYYNYCEEQQWAK